MRVIPQSMTNALAGSSANASVRFNAWYAGALAAQALNVSVWSIEWTGDKSTLIQGKLTLTVDDKSGTLAPWALSDALGVAGSEIQAQFLVGSDIAPLGWYVISQNAPSETWRVSGSAMRWVSGGASIPLSADDRTLLVQDARFMAPEAPPSGTTVLAEIRRILSGLMTVTVGPGIVDVNVPSTLTYSKDRIGALYDLVRLLNGWCRMSGDGQLEIYSLARTAPVWTIQGGDGGALIAIYRQQDRSTLFNAVVSTSTQATPELVGYAYTTTGATRFDGPLKRKPEFHNAIATTQAGVNADAEAFRQSLIQNAAQTLKIYCLPNPAIQIGDWVRIASPMISGTTYNLDGMVTKMKLSGDTNGMGEMELNVRCEQADVAAVAQWLRKQ